jgi:hypothetical protein
MAMIIDKAELIRLLEYENDIKKLTELFHNAKNGHFSFDSNTSAFCFFCTIYVLTKKYSGPYQITDFLYQDKIVKNSRYYELYEPLFIAETVYPNIEKDSQEIVK